MDDDSRERERALAANEGFYRAFSGGDFAAMTELWAQNADVTCEHPGGAPLQGRADVLESWRRILDAGGAPGIHATDATVDLSGPRAVVRCQERLGDAAISAINELVLEAGEWRLTSHRAAPG